MKNLAFLFISGLLMQLVAQERFVITDVKVFDGETVIEKTSVRVDNGLISEIGPTVDTTGIVRIIDGANKTLIPALSNAHVHAWAPQSLQQAARAGVLNVMDMHGVEPYQVVMRQLKDSTNYARFYVAGYAATVPEGHGTQFGFPVPTLSGPDDAKTFIEGRIKANVDYIKIIVEPWKKTLDSETVTAVIEEAHKVQKIAVVHVSRLEDAIDVLSNNANGLVHIWWDKPISDQQLNSLSTDKTFFVIPTLLTTLKAFESMGEAAQKFMNKTQLLAEIKKLHEAGILLLAGTDPPNLGINYGTDLYKELGLLQEAGLKPVEVLKAGTSNIASAFSLKHIGYIKKGYFADLLLIDGDVTEDISTIEKIQSIWKKGVKVN
ncbi:amidohydrolase family protein [Winogradskyella sp. DF17]|uniref:Amidohydrolase family protein n=1 Tax=Winogradskyella pelagia TaxID=2819984 RepID=A0ABS3T076_9FLAO|nr:amidohydrolase family protein [Winogradskyella sp. DF17]MBO3116147.1 amidohydrolase family protein [Winogradskyella sp. DF17]